MIKAEIVAHSLSPQGDELISVLCTFPRIILAEVNTHRMFSRNTSSSRAIPFKKMVEAVQNNPFIPIAWQKNHKGMQGNEYHTDPYIIKELESMWEDAKDSALHMADTISNEDVTKQLCNRLLEPFMWTTMLITGPRSGWENFFELRCPNYIFHTDEAESDFHFRSRKEAIKEFGEDEEVEFDYGNVKLKDLTHIEWLKVNYSQAEIHIMDLAEKIWDALNESKPKVLKAGEWHIPFRDKIVLSEVREAINTVDNYTGVPAFVKISTAIAARTSYTVVGDEKEIDYAKMIELHDRLINQTPPHSSPLEHCARAMTDEEYVSFIKGVPDVIEYEKDEIAISYLKTYEDSPEAGWCNNFKGFIPYRYMVDNNIN